ncbi:nibrin [Thalassophryne amazonica]|uniref:nibrin n=1 Tax=Thalassophryne amazonica TaxID=390379 RepID=UPI001471FBB9|nr:nibrin [Thalassophryne amazonica]
MWILTPLQPGGETHYIFSDKEYVVGRKNCDILISNDQSISRAHAVLMATDQTLTLKDTSKYGTFVNNCRVTENTQVDLNAGDSVTFGAFNSKFSVQRQKPVVCSSCVDNEGKVSLSQALVSLGGRLVNSWTEDCTHLVIPTLKVTIKTISALLCCRPIVKPVFFSELSKAVQQKLPPPKAESFIPEIDEPSLSKEHIKIGAVPGRKQLFSGKTFVFLTARQLKRLSAAVAFGGGKSNLLEEGSLPHDLLESPQSCVVDITTGSSQALLSSSVTEWANSVKSITQRKGLRVIAESEIGLAAIYASCDKYCNPSSPITESESVQDVKPKILSASLSQNAAVDETVLPTTSHNITAYVVNTQQSQRTEVHKVTEVTTVAETPEKSNNQNTDQLNESRRATQTMTTSCIVEETVNSSVNIMERTDSQTKKHESKLSGRGSDDAKSRASHLTTNGDVKTFTHRQAPQEQKNSAQGSPQKQSCLTAFFQPVSKKRSLEDELAAVTSEPKRGLLASSIAKQSTKSSATFDEAPSQPSTVPATTSQNPLGSGADLFMRKSDSVSKEESRGKKRKQVEAEITMKELESIMSEDMDCFDEQMPDSQHVNTPAHGSTNQTRTLNTEDSTSVSKRQRVFLQENVKTNQKSSGDLEENANSSTHHSHKFEARPTDQKVPNHESRKALDDVPAANTHQEMQICKEDEAPFIKDSELLEADIWQSKEVTETTVKPVTGKQETTECSMEGGLPKNVVLVEFRSLTVTAPSKARPQQTQSSGFSKNFKCFRKSRVPGSDGSPQIIGGSDLLAHNRGKNTDLDEWLKDAAEEEHQSKREETEGDYLFRYNPTKLSKRR